MRAREKKKKCLQDPAHPRNSRGLIYPAKRETKITIASCGKKASRTPKGFHVSSRD